jgi:predicted transcriptional regulator YheO
MKADQKERTVPLEEREANLFETLKVVGRAIVATFGDRCEVVIHDLSKPEVSIVWIEGNVTGRSVGGSATDLLLKELRRGDREEILNYGGYAAGKVMKSSTILFREDDMLYGALCINFDVTDFVAAEYTLRSFCKPATEEEEETFVQDLTEILETMIAEACYEVGMPVGSMDKDEKVRLVDILEQRGAFEIKRAVPLVASRLGVSRFTIYNYLSEARAAKRY